MNIFITNRGNGIHPEDFIAEIWEDKMPMINFGNILSFDKQFFAKKWGNINTFRANYLGKRVYIKPKLYGNLALAKSIYSLSIPLIQNAINLVEGDSAQSIMNYIDEIGLTHPNWQLSQEAIVLSPYKRNPSHILIETDNYLGGILFNGRYEKIPVACLLDEVNIINLIQNKLDILEGEKIINAVKIDGGSAAKIALFNKNKNLIFGNLVAPGIRNNFGDGDSNFYGGIVFELTDE